MTEVLLHDLNQGLQALVDEKNYEFAFSLGRHILHHWPRHLDTYVQLGQAALAAGRYADAADLLRRALSADPEDRILWAALAQAATALGLGEEAAIARQHARDILPPASDDWSETAQRYRQVYEISPENVQAALGLATAYSHLGQHQISRTLAEQVLMQLPYCLKAHLLVVHAIEQSSGIEAVNGHLKIACEFDPDHLYAWRWFGAAGDPEPAPTATLPPWSELEN